MGIYCLQIKPSSSSSNDSGINSWCLKLDILSGGSTGFTWEISNGDAGKTCQPNTPNQLKGNLIGTKSNTKNEKEKKKHLYQ